MFLEQIEALDVVENVTVERLSDTKEPMTDEFMVGETWRIWVYQVTDA